MRTAAEIARAVARREVSPVEIAEEALRLADGWQPAINAFSRLDPEATLGEARAVEERLARGEEPGRLAGVPVAVKDLFDVTGWETTGCCRAFRGRVADRDAAAVRALREAGAVVVGKTNQHELAAGATNLVSDCGPTLNPWDPDRITGGSSGGSAAAVAAGLVPVALGSDTGGSIRIPASMCGVVGLKPTTGSVPMEGAMPLSPSLDTAGPLTAAVEDAGMALEVLRGRPGLDPQANPTVALLATGYGTLADDEVLAATAAVADVLSTDGVTVRSGEVAGLDDALDVWERLAWGELARSYPGLADSEDVHPRTRELLAFGQRVGGGLDDARRAATRVRDAFLVALRDTDALLLPATPFPAPRADEREFASLGLDMRTGAPSVLTRPVNLAGLPAGAFPAGLSGEGMPIGVQLVGRAGEEATLLSLASRYLDRTWYRPSAPPLPGEPRHG